MTTTSSESTYAYRAGFEAGSGLLDPQPSLHRVRSHEQEQMAQERRDAEIALGRLELRRDWRARDLDVAAGRHGSRRAVVERLSDERDEKPAAFSRVRGTIYIAFAILILIADFAILSQVIAQLFGFKVNARGLGHPGQALFENFPAALTAYGEVYLTTIGVLLVAMALKVWNDRAPRKPLPDSATRAERFGRLLEEHTQWLVLGVAVLTVVMVAVVRLLVDVGGAGRGAADEGGVSMIGVVATIIGIACPFVGVLLFSRGLEALGAGRRLASLTRTADRLERIASRIRARWEKQTTRHVDRRIRKDFLDRTDTEERRLKIADDQFRLGYAAGVTDLLGRAGSRGAYRKLRLRFPTR